jgi:Integrase core domain
MPPSAAGKKPTRVGLPAGKKPTRVGLPLPRFGALGRKGSIAVIERFFRTLKTEGLRRILIPMRLHDINEQLGFFARWYNAHRPHRAHDGATPAEMRDGATPKHMCIGFETRPLHPLRGKLTKRRRTKQVQRVKHLQLVIEHVEGQQHLPIIALRPAA